MLIIIISSIVVITVITSNIWNIYRYGKIAELELIINDLKFDNETLKKKCIGISNNRFCESCEIDCRIRKKIERENGMENIIEKITKLGIKEHIEFMEGSFPFKIDESVNNTIVYEKSIERIEIEPRFNETIIEVRPTTVMSDFEVICKNDNSNVAVVNPASYYDPCGMFATKIPFLRDGVEENICANTNLANILYAFKNTFYEYNRHNEHFKGLYSNRALFIPNVQFRTATNSGVGFNVISITPPDGNKFKKSFLINPLCAPRKINTALALRIEMLLNIAYENNISTLIISGFGSEDNLVKPEIVADIFNKYLNGRFKNAFEKIHFCISKSEHEEIYDIFRYEFIEKR